MVRRKTAKSLVLCVDEWEPKKIYEQIAVDVLGLTYRLAGVLPYACCCFIVFFSPRYNSY